MLNWIKDKKAMSPILALLIVLGVTIVVGAVFYAWGSGMFDSSQEKTQSAIEGTTSTMAYDAGAIGIALPKEISVEGDLDLGDVDSWGYDSKYKLEAKAHDSSWGTLYDERIIVPVPITLKNYYDSALTNVKIQTEGADEIVALQLKKTTVKDTNGNSYDSYILCDKDGNEFEGLITGSGIKPGATFSETGDQVGSDINISYNESGTIKNITIPGGTPAERLDGGGHKIVYNDKTILTNTTPETIYIGNGGPYSITAVDGDSATTVESKIQQREVDNALLKYIFAPSSVTSSSAVEDDKDISYFYKSSWGDSKHRQSMRLYAGGFNNFYYACAYNGSAYFGWNSGNAFNKYSTPIDAYFFTNEYDVGTLQKGQSVSKEIYYLFGASMGFDIGESLERTVEIPVKVVSDEGVSKQVNVKITLNDR